MNRLSRRQVLVSLGVGSGLSLGATMSSHLKRVVAVEPLPRHQLTADFFSWSLRGQLGGKSLDPFLNLDDFHMSQPTFPPHPHAGFSAVTYLFEDSKGSFRNRDSRGNAQRIGPGALHWTEAASGVVHEEVPTVPGVDCHGLQMFVNLPVSRHVAPPRALHLDAKEVPELRPAAGVRVRVLAGALASTTSPLDVVPAVTFLDVHLDPGARVQVPAAAGQTAFALVVAGAGLAGAGSPLSAHEGVRFDDEAGVLELSTKTQALHALVGVGTPLQQQVLWRGPFALATAEAHEDARRRYASGAMGQLEPSF
ncbi:MAG: pirin family protein [Myxococcaceae bacterium]|nr:pirin family protein [Myxococcaceae bacterium]